MPAITKDGAQPQRFTKKPVTIEAIQYTGGGNFANPALPEWMWAALESGIVLNRKGELVIKTLEGEHVASPGDWIIQGVKGEIYPCKPDIFAMTYEAEHITDTAATQAAQLTEDELMALVPEAKIKELWAMCAYWGAVDVRVVPFATAIVRAAILANQSQKG